MTTISKTSIVYNQNYKSNGLVPFFYRVRNCDTNMTSNTPANQYQRQKIIQNTVRVPSSLYTMNLGSLTSYARPTKATYGVCWNQMSDRPVPSIQTAQVPTGTNNSLNGRHRSVTSSKPGSQTPGGIGCDIKHNSYDRYLKLVLLVVAIVVLLKMKIILWRKDKSARAQTVAFIIIHFIILILFPNMVLVKEIMYML